jgi:hypothetical protein
MASFKPPQQFITIVAVRVKPYKIFVAIQIRHNIIPIVGILWTPTKKTAITAQFFCSAPFSFILFYFNFFETREFLKVR